MKILSLAVDNFRGISGGLDKNRLYFADSNTIFIFGPNNVGKSTYLAAYDFLYHNTTAVDADFFERDCARQITFELEAGIDDQDLTYLKENLGKKFESFQRYVSESSVIKVRKRIPAQIEKKRLKPLAPIDETWNPKSGSWDESAFGTLGLAQVFQKLLPRPILIKAMPTEEEVEAVINEILAAKARAALADGTLSQLDKAQQEVRKLQDELYNPSLIERYKAEVNERFSRLFPDIGINFEDSDKVKWTEDKFGKKFLVQFEKKNGDGSINTKIPSSYDTIGHGAVRSAIFSLLLMRDYDSEGPAKGRKEYLVLFEEPELFLHPHLMRQLRDLVYSVSVGSSPFQVLCASHSPQMIDLSRTKSSLVRMVRTEEGTKLFQLSDPDLIAAQNTDSKLDLKERMYEVLRFNPYICESFYADEVVLIEGPTEELMLRGILQTEKAKKDIFIVNCGSITNVPFYQRIYEKFSIRYHVICDTDDVPEVRKGKNLNPIYDSGIQKTVSTLCEESESAGLLRTFTPTFEPAHRDSSVPIKLRLPEYPISDGKPYNANLYWKEILATQYGASAEIERVPIIRYVKEILAHTWL